MAAKNLRSRVEEEVPLVTGELSRDHKSPNYQVPTPVYPGMGQTSCYKGLSIKGTLMLMVSHTDLEALVLQT